MIFVGKERDDAFTEGNIRQISRRIYSKTKIHAVELEE
jgi:hypothetical protein